MSYLNDLQNYSEEHIFHKDAIRVANQFETDAYVINGVVRWKSNNNVPPKEVLELWDYLNKDFSFNASMHAQENDTREFIKQYKKQQRNKTYSEEELHEMKSAFGEGTTVVDIITGETIKL